MKLFAVAFAAVTLALSASAAHASTLIVNGGFETGDDPGSFTTYGTGTQIGNTPGWTVNDGSIDYIGTYWQPSEGSRSVDMSGNEAGTISQSFNTVAGTKYQVHFDYAGNPDNKDTGVEKILETYVTGGSLLFDDQYSFDVTNTSKDAMGWLGVTYSFIADSSSATLFFKSLTFTSFGPALDNISVAAVPLPASLPMFGAGLVALAVMAKRRRHQGVRA